VRKVGLVLLSALIWALAGGVFGALFSAMDLAFDPMFDDPRLGTLLAAALSGMITAAFFGAMPVALLGTLLGVLVGIGYLMLPPDPSSPVPLLLIALAVGLVAGALLPRAAVLRSRPLGQAGSGLVAGAIAGPLVTYTRSLGAPWGKTAVSAAVAVAAVGLLYVVFARVIVRRCSDRLSFRVGGPMVAGVIAAAVSVCIWLIGATTGSVVDDQTVAHIHAILRQAPDGFIGAAIGGAAGGALLEIAGIQLGAYHL
jgi:hypothetical protein